MRRLSPSSSFATRIVVFVQLATVAIGVGLLLEFRDRIPSGLLDTLIALAVFAAAITVYGWIATVRGHVLLMPVLAAHVQRASWAMSPLSPERRGSNHHTAEGADDHAVNKLVLHDADLKKV